MWKLHLYSNAEFVFKCRADANTEISIWPFTIWFLTPWLHSYEDPGYRWQLYPFAYRTQVIYYTFWCSKINFSMFSIYSVSLKIVCHFSALSCGNLIFMHWFVVKVVYIALSLRARYFALWLRSINLAIRRVTFYLFINLRSYNFRHWWIWSGIFHLLHKRELFFGFERLSIHSTWL